MIKDKKIKVWKNGVENNLKKFVSFPTPAKNKIPTWYKDARMNVRGDKKARFINGNSGFGVKACVPFNDAMKLGYIIELHCDVIVEKNNDGTHTISWSSPTPPIVSRPFEISNQVQKKPGYGGYTQAWQFNFGISLPSGYSLIVTNPLNHFELPFITTSGVVDADSGLIDGAIPFSIEENFEGLIRQGTPIMQIIPFKRDNWKMINSSIEDESIGNLWTPRNTISGWYKQNIWKQKRFE